MSVSQPLSMRHEIDGVLTDYTSLKLSDPTAAFGVRRRDTGGIAVADDISFAHDGTGLYSYTITGLVEGKTYDGYVERVYGGETKHDAFEFVAAASAAAAGYYADQADLEDFIGLDNDRILSNLANDTTIADALRVQRALDHADAQINAAFGGGPYAVPLAPVTAVMTAWAVVIAANWLSNGRGDRGKDGKFFNPYAQQVAEVYADMGMYKAGLKQFTSAGRAADVGGGASVVSDADVIASRLGDPVVVGWWPGW